MHFRCSNAIVGVGRRKDRGRKQLIYLQTAPYSVPSISTIEVLGYFLSLCLRFFLYAFSATGAANRRDPTGGSAYGIPLKTAASPSRIPATTPREVCASGGICEGVGSAKLSRAALQHMLSRTACMHAVVKVVMLVAVGQGSRKQSYQIKAIS